VEVMQPQALGMFSQGNTTKLIIFPTNLYFYNKYTIEDLNTI